MKSLRLWATPLIVGSFLIMGVSGVLMFFHLETTLMKVVHEWAGWAMVAGAVALGYPAALASGLLVHGARQVRRGRLC